MLRPSTPPPALPVSSRLVLDMRLGGAIKGDSDLVAVRDPAGNVELLARASSGAIYNVRRSPTSDTGWEQTALGNPFTATSLAIGDDGSRVVAFAGGINEALPEIHTASRGADGSWSEWTQLPLAHSGVPNGLGVSRILTVRGTSTVYLFAILQVGPGAPNSGELSLWWVPWDSDEKAWQQVGTPASNLVAAATMKAGGAGVLAFERSQVDPTSFDLKLFPVPSNGAPQLVLSGSKATHLTAGLQANGYSGVFLCEDSLTTGDMTFSFIDGSAEAPESTTIPTVGNTGCSQLLAADAGQTPLALFLLGGDHRLYVIYQPAIEAWRSPFELGDRFARIAQALDSRDSSEIFGFDLTDTLRHLWDDARGSDPSAWHEEPIDLPIDTIQQVPSYSTRLTVRDPAGNLLPNHDVALYAGSVLPAVVNGRSVVLGSKTATTVTSDARGVITVYSATDSLNTAKLRVVISSDTDEWILRNSHSQEKLAQANVEDVKNLLPAKYQNHAEDVHQAVQRLMTAVHGQAINRVSFDDSIAVSRLPADFDFRFDVQNGRATFTSLTAPDCTDLIALYSIAPEPMSWVSFWEWLGDIVESAEHAVESAFTYVVCKVEDGIYVAIDLVIRGVKYVYSGIIKLVEEAFSVVTAIFSSVGVFFSRLFKFVGWLITDAAQDIWNTKTAITAALERLFPTLDRLFDEGEDKVANFFDGLQGEVDAKFCEVIDALGDTTFNYMAQQPQAAAAPAATAPLDIAQDNSAISNWFFDKLTSPSGQVSFDPTVSATLLADALKLIEDLGATIGGSIKEQFNLLGEYLEKVVKNPADFMALTVKELLLQAKALIDGVLKVAKRFACDVLRIAKDAFDGLNDGVLARPVSGFFITGIYNAINPGAKQTPTVLDLVGLFAAVPATVLFQAVQGHAPYTDADVAAMKSSGLSPAEHQRVHGLAADNPHAAIGLNVSGFIAGLLMIPFAILETGGDATGTPSLADTGPGPATLVTELIALIGGILLPLGILALALPPLTWGTDEDTWININWLAWFGPIFVNLVVFLATGFQKLGPDSVIGIWPYAITGVVLLAVGIVALVYEDDRDFWMGWLNIALPFPTTLKPLLLIEHPIARIVLLALDIVCDVGAALAGMRLAAGSDKAFANNRAPSPPT